MSDQGFLVLQSGETFGGRWHGGRDRMGEVVFNTSHSGYEETATDPSYLHQIIVHTAPQVGNYGIHEEARESRQVWIEGLVCVEMQASKRDRSWEKHLTEAGVPILSEVDTRKLVIRLREQGTPLGAIVSATNSTEARAKFDQLQREFLKLDTDWVYECTRKQVEDIQGIKKDGPRIAVLDFGVKNNSLRELKKRCSQIRIFPSRTSSQEIRNWNPDGLLLSNGPGDPSHVKVAVQTVQELLGTVMIFGICMGHQILALALGGRTYKLKFGHRGANHPIHDHLHNRIYVTSQNHGYSVDMRSLPESVQVTHINLNDQTVAGLSYPEKRCLSVQFHPESHPGPHDSEFLFDFFVRGLK